MTLTKEQLKAIVQEMHDYLVAMEKEEGYRFISARGCLSELNYKGSTAQDVLQYIFERGFQYCLDYTFPSRTFMGEDQYTPQHACVWGVDQLRSRIRCVLV